MKIETIETGNNTVVVSLSKEQARTLRDFNP